MGQSSHRPSVWWSKYYSDRLKMKKWILDSEHSKLFVFIFVKLWKQNKKQIECKVWKELIFFFPFFIWKIINHTKSGIWKPHYAGECLYENSKIISPRCVQSAAYTDCCVISQVLVKALSLKYKYLENSCFAKRQCNTAILLICTLRSDLEGGRKVVL